ncbi:MAG: Fe-S protein assembly co-chaperone HscB [Thiotrichaceae bacterium]|nr:Fe-S protein assembly co-chaperone HscB [Thiotrichaceae bacterium]
MQSISLTQNYFELFDLPIQFEIDKAALSAQFLRLQTSYHPDKFVNSSDEERRFSLQITGYLNEALDTLKSIRLRAYYLLTLKGVSFNDDRDTTTDMPYLLEQMEIRQSIEDVEQTDDPMDELDKLRQIITVRQDDVEQNFVTNYQQGNYTDAKQAVLKLRYCERIFGEIQRMEDRLDDF